MTSQANQYTTRKVWGRLETVTLWWMLAIPMAVAVLGGVVIGSAFFAEPNRAGEDWSVVVGGALLIVALVGLTSNLPCFILVRKVAKSHSLSKERLAISVAAIPVVVLLLPISWAIRAIFVVGAVASLPYLAFRLLGRIVRIGE